MSYISKEITEQILRAQEGKLQDVIAGFSPLKRSGSSFTTVCPRCGRENGLVITPGKGIFKCFKCGDVKGKSAIDYLMTGKGMSYPDALTYIANLYGIIIPEERRKAPEDGKKSKSFCDKMLQGSGLTRKDTYADTYEDRESKVIKQLSTFKSGTIDDRGNIIDGDDCIIHYYDLDGYPVTYTNQMLEKHAANPEREYFRVRWQYPDEHKDKSGRAAKYHTPYGASTPLYIPQKIRDLYKKGNEITRLFIQEGEKKAEKACKHGIFSLAISGIQNFGYRGQLPEDIARIVERCKVKEIIFMLDSDCFDITDHLRCDEPIERRPLNFFYAVKNYKEYLNTLKNRGFYLEVYFGHVLKNEKGDKGVDDLLADTLKGHEEKLKKDIDTAINTKGCTGDYVQLYKITTMPDSKIREIWNLQSAEKFCPSYEEELKNLPEFIFGRHKWRYNEKGELESAQPIENDEQFWEVINKNKVEKDGAHPMYEFRYERCLNFLHNRGFGKYTRDAMQLFVHLEDKVVKIVNVTDIRDFVFSFTRTFLKEDILEMLHKGGPQYLGDFRLAQMKYANIQFQPRERSSEYLYWKDKYWVITKDKIEEKGYTQLHHFIWGNQKKDYNPQILPDMWKITRSVDKESNETYTIQLNELGKKCDFLRFLVNCSNFTWRKEKMLAAKSGDVSITSEELAQNQHHLVAKLAAIGYLLSEYKDPSVTKAVVGVDGKQSEIGESNGRSGKSLLGELFKIATPTCYINGKIADVERDTFIWSEVTENTRCVFIDDVKRQFDFEMLFPNITGPWAINYKGGGRATLPFSLSPKIYLTTNHMLNGDSESFIDRQWSIAFSDFYNARHKPMDDFGEMFFTEWDEKQWNLFWNLIAQCIKVYHQYGYVESPGERIQQRRLRQSIGEEFIAWADEFFSAENHRNTELARKSLYDNLIAAVGVARSKFYTAPVFKGKLRNYCKWKGYIYNPQKFNKLGQPLSYDKDGKPIIDDKRSGVEYFIIGDKNYYSLNGNDPTSEIIGLLNNEQDDDDELI